MRRIYRGTVPDCDLRIEGGVAPHCLFAASTVEGALIYGSRIEEIGVPDDARILKEGTAEFARVTRRRRGILLRTMRQGENLLTAANAVVESAEKAGYDAVEFVAQSDLGIAIINEAAFERHLEREISHLPSSPRMG